ncbi:hypothetical protein L798_00161 [Zootermopsis nevadensis]|uniref:Uncharacterized protein n=1 Tax=Zootermopsis nevadensis TaxID=136037 RepID=A0A067RSP9_ZOONE|nr:hypothetical protein L798_00161 [Zootermopsis nevadensis]
MFYTFSGTLYGSPTFFLVSLIYGHSVGLLGQGIGPSQGLYLNTGQHNTEKHPWLEWDSNPRSPRPSGTRPTPQTARPLRTPKTCLYILKKYLYLNQSLWN